MRGEKVGSAQKTNGLLSDRPYGRFGGVLTLFITVSLLAACNHTMNWALSGDAILNTNDGNVGIGTTSPTAKLTVVDDATTPIPSDVYAISSTIATPTNGRAVHGAAINANGLNNYGGYFTAAGEGAGGVFGEATDPGHAGTGGVFHSAGKKGKGVIGLAYNNDQNAENFGGWFDARGRGGIGIFAKGGEDGHAARFIGSVQIVGGLDVAEGFDINNASGGGPIAAGTVLIIDDSEPGKLTVGNTPYDSRVAGIVAGAKNLSPGIRLGDQFDIYVALAGRVYCKVDATHEAISPGDLLTTSSSLGYAMKASDATRAQGAILGKAMESLEQGNKGEILVLVTLQ